MKSKQKICSGLGVFFAILGVLTAYAYAIDGNDSVENQYFSINIPDSWTYLEYSHTPESKTTGLGPPNGILLTSSNFSDMLLSPDFQKYSEKIQEGGLSARFHQDTDYRIKNAPLESYVKYVIDNYGIQNITSQHYTTVGNEKAVRLSANDSAVYGKSNVVLYVVMHDKQPYEINYLANPKNFEKYLPEFEQMVKSFRFVGGASSENGENLTNTRTNFSGANLTGSNSSDYRYTTPTNQKNQEELYNECVNVAGKSLCDFLFKR
jgi:hypothetical protein